jgi:hypothetical protein
MAAPTYSRTKSPVSNLQALMRYLSISRIESTVQAAIVQLMSYWVTTSLIVDGYLRSKGATSGIGYASGAGGTVTQGTSKSTGVTLSKVCGEITMHNATLNAATIVSFVATNTAIEAGDLLVINHVSGGTIGSYTFTAACAAGSATIYVRNATAGNLGEAIVLRYALIKGVTA